MIFLNFFCFLTVDAYRTKVFQLLRIEGVKDDVIVTLFDCEAQSSFWIVISLILEKAVAGLASFATDLPNSNISRSCVLGYKVIVVGFLTIWLRFSDPHLSVSIFCTIETLMSFWILKILLLGKTARKTI